MSVDLYFGDFPVAHRVQGADGHPADVLQGEAKVDHHIEVFAHAAQNAIGRIVAHPVAAEAGRGEDFVPAQSFGDREGIVGYGGAVVGDAYFVPFEKVGGKALFTKCVGIGFGLGHGGDDMGVFGLAEPGVEADAIDGHFSAEIGNGVVAEAASHPRRCPHALNEDAEHGRGAVAVVGPQSTRQGHAHESRILALGDADIAAQIVKGHLALAVLVPTDDVSQVQVGVNPRRSHGSIGVVDQSIGTDPLGGCAHRLGLYDLTVGAVHGIEAAFFAFQSEGGGPGVAVLSA